MAELDLRKSPWNEGLGVSPDYLLQQLYFLGCAVNASKSIESLGVHGLVALRGRFQESEIGRLLVTVASIIRNAMDQAPARTEYWMENLDDKVGTFEALGSASPAATLTFREACNKILHCTALNFDYSEDAPARGGPINPIVHLYGEQKGKEWRATLDVNRFIDHANELA